MCNMMGRPRNERTQTAVLHRPSVRREKKEPFRGWEVDDVLEDIGLEYWVKRRNRDPNNKQDQHSRRAVREPHLDWDAYVCNLYSKCTHIDDWNNFKESSLPFIYKPESLQAENPNNQVKNLKDIRDIKVDAKDSLKEEIHAKDEDEKIPAKDDKSNSEKTEVAQATEKKRAKTASSSKHVEDKLDICQRSNSASSAYSSKEKAERKKYKDIPEKRAMLEISENKQIEQSKDQIKDEGEDESSEEAMIPSSRKGSSSGSYQKPQTQRFEIKQPPPPVKLSYRQANISLLKPNAGNTKSTDGSHITKEDNKTKSRLMLSDGERLPVSIGNPNKDYFLTALRKFTLPPRKDETRDLEEEKSSQNKSPLPESETSAKTQGHKGMAVVMKTLTLEEAACKHPLINSYNIPVLNREKSPRPTISRAESQNSNKNGICTISIDSSYFQYAQNTNNSNGLKVNDLAEGMETYIHNYYGERRGSSPYFPIADLLPAVDKSIVNSMSHRRVRSADSDSVDFYPNEDYEDYGRGLEREINMLGSKDGLLPYEESLLMMREGVDLLRLKERNQSFLGPPAFRPQHQTRNPLRRARENTAKRLSSHWRYNHGHGNEEVTDPASHWPSSAGSLYPKRNSPVDTHRQGIVGNSDCSSCQGNLSAIYGVPSHTSRDLLPSLYNKVPLAERDLSLPGEDFLDAIKLKRQQDEMKQLAKITPITR